MRARLGLFLLPLLAGACTSARDRDVRAALDDAFSSARASLAATGAPDIVLPAGLTDPAPPRQPARLGASVPDTATAMIGQPVSRLRDAFGAPDLVRRDGPAEVWLYRGETCHLDVMIYAGPPGGEPQVSFAAARAAGLTRTGEAACLRELAGGPPAPPPGLRLTRAPGDES